MTIKWDGTYCSRCGSPMQRDPKPVGFNTYTGKPRWTYSCPNNRWWRTTDHDRGVTGA